MITEIRDAAQIIGQHETIALQFSGGKDSLACLYLLRPYWDKITVAWNNTGAALPETIEQMKIIKAMVPHFLEVKTNQPAQNARNGLPSEIIPIRSTGTGKSLQPADSSGPLLQSYLDCCWMSLWQPMQQAMINLGATLLIRGQRASESRKAPINSGATSGGIQVWFPIEEWTEQQVFDYLKAERIPIPAHYEYTKASIDCWSCTAYLDEGIGRMRYLQAKHPELWKIQKQRMATVRQAIQSELARDEYTQANLLIDMVD